VQWRRSLPRSDVVWAVALVMAVFLWVASALWIIDSLNVSADDLTPKGSLAREIEECRVSRSFGRDAASITASLAGRSRIWDVMVTHYELPVGVVASVIALSIFWLIALQTCGYVAVWTTMFIKSGALIVLGIRFDHYGFTEAAHSCWIAGFGLGFFTLWQARRINLSARILQKVGQSLRSAGPSMWFSLIVLQIIFLASFVGFTFVATSSFYVWEMRRTDSGLCKLQRSAFARNLQAATSIVFAWLAATIRAAKVLVVASSTACWYYPRLDEGSGGYPSLLALGWSFSTSAGTLSVAGAIAALASKAEHAAFSRQGGGCCERLRQCCMCECLNPLSFISQIIWYILESCAVSATRFAVIAHFFTSKSFWASAVRAYRTMGARGSVGGFIVSEAVDNVITMGSYIFSIIIGLAVWEYTDRLEGLQTLSNTSRGMTRELLFYALFSAYLMLTYYPITALILISLFSEWVPYWFTPFLCSVFLGSASHLLFGFLGDVILAASNTIYFCYCIDTHTGQRRPIPLTPPRPMRPYSSQSHTSLSQPKIPSAPLATMELQTLYGQLETANGPMPVPSAPLLDAMEEDDEWEQEARAGWTAQSAVNLNDDEERRGGDVWDRDVRRQGPNAIIVAQPLRMGEEKTYATFVQQREAR